MRLLKEDNGKVLYYKHSQGELVYFDSRNDGHIVFHKMDSGIQQLLINGDLVVLVDAGTTSNCYMIGNCRVIIASSPSIQNFKDIVKDREPKELHMPVWSLDELLDAQRSIVDFSDVTAHEVKEGYARFGGSARFVLSNSQQRGSYERKLKKAINGASVKTLFAQMSRVDTSAESHMLLHQHLVENNDGQVEIALRFASKSIEEELCEKVFKDVNGMKWLMHSARKIPALGSFRGLLFEPYVIHYLCTTDHDFTIRRLCDGKSREEKYVAEELFPYTKRSRIVFDNYEHLMALSKQDNFTTSLLVPRNHNFETVDAIIPPNKLLQMTVTVKHDAKSVGMDEILKILNTLEENKINESEDNKKERYSLYFIVPQDIYWYFQKGEAKCTTSQAEVAQYAVKFPKVT